MQLFFSNQISDSSIVFSEEESWHCVKVLRHKAGDKIQVIDGQGGFYSATLLDAHPKHCTLKIDEAIKHYKQKPYQLHIAIAPTKNADRIEWFAEKAVEAGIDEISFILCKTSERKVIKTDRIKKIVESAVKQSVQAYIPAVNELLSLPAFLKNTENFKGKKFIAHCRNEELKLLKDQIQNSHNILCLIGPEGDFTEDEIALALKNGFEPISLGVNRLRTETAGVYVSMVLNYEHFNSPV